MLQTPYKIYFLAAIFVFLATGVFGQITSPGGAHSKYIVYRVSGSTDSMLVFTFDELPGRTVTGSLDATGPSAGNFTFEWSAWDTVSMGFGPVFQTDNSTNRSSVTGLQTGGYQVRAFNGAGVDTTFTAWVFIDDLRANIEKTPSGHVLPYKYTCDFLVMSGSVSLDTFYFYDPASHERILMQEKGNGEQGPVNGFTFLWTSDNANLTIPNADRVLDPNTTYLPPYKDTWYFLTATDSFGMRVRDSVFYESIQVKSEFSFMFFDRADKKEFVEPPAPPQDGAPLLVKFTNHSLNGSTFEWIYADSAKSGFFADEFTSDEGYEPEYTYFIPGDYYPALVATSAAGCIDTFRVETPITVLPSELKVQNVFSPNGDNLNDYFKVEFKSIKQFTLRIYSRSGVLVYSADVSDLYSWDGWDGKIKDSNRDASPGAYYYIIEATGYDNIHYRTGSYKGVVYLFR